MHPIPTAIANSSHCVVSNSIIYGRSMLPNAAIDRPETAARSAAVEGPGRIACWAAIRKTCSQLLDVRPLSQAWNPSPASEVEIVSPRRQGTCDAKLVPERQLKHHRKLTLAILLTYF